MAEQLADHFNALSSEFQGLKEIPTSNGPLLPALSHTQIEVRLRELKKPKSRVKGDIFSRTAGTLAGPVTNIYNEISRSGQWPSASAWKMEFVTPIPKVPMPQTANDLRNISCTMLVSMVYESFVLNWLTGQIGLKHNLYGGVKGHLLVRLWQDVLEALGDLRAAVPLTSIDFAKAFNRLDFGPLHQHIEEQGTFIRSGDGHCLLPFQMTVKVGNSFSDPKPVLGGVPQGSLLGLLLFNCSIDSFEATSGDVGQYRGGTDTGTDHPVSDKPLFIHLPLELYK